MSVLVRLGVVGTGWLGLCSASSCRGKAGGNTAENLTQNSEEIAQNEPSSNSGESDKTGARSHGDPPCTSSDVLADPEVARSAAAPEASSSTPVSSRARQPREPLVYSQHHRSPPRAPQRSPSPAPVSDHTPANTHASCSSTPGDCTPDNSSSMQRSDNSSMRALSPPAAVSPAGSGQSVAIQSLAISDPNDDSDADNTDAENNADSGANSPRSCVHSPAAVSHVARVQTRLQKGIKNPKVYIDGTISYQLF
nr:lisH domain-containing protein C1711.05-like [Lolium perenne]